MHVVKTLKRAPNPSTTRYPIPTERGGSPPNMDSCPLYLSKGGNSSSIIDDTMMLEKFLPVAITRHRWQKSENNERPLLVVEKVGGGGKTDLRLKLLTLLTPAHHSAFSFFGSVSNKNGLRHSVFPFFGSKSNRNGLRQSVFSFFGSKSNKNASPFESVTAGGTHAAASV
jgi:hypothetical protein